MIQTFKATFGNSNLKSAEVFFFPQGEELLVLLVHGEGEDIFARVRLLSSDVEEFFLTHPGKMSERFQLCQDFLQNQLNSKPQVLLIFISNSKIYINSSGEFKVLLARNSQQTLLIKDPKDLLSGSLLPGDKILVLDDLDGLVQAAQIKNAFLDPADLDEIISEQIRDIRLKNPLLASILSFETPLPIQEALIKTPKFKLSLPSIKLTRPRLPKFRFSKIVYPALGVLLLIGLFFIFRAFQSYQVTQRSFNLKFSQAQVKMLQAKALNESDPDAAKTSYQESKLNIKQALEILPKEKKALSLLLEINNLNSAIYKTTEVTNWSSFLTLNLIKQDFKSNRLSLSGNNLAILDQTQQSLVLVNLDTKAPVILAGSEQMGQAELASINGEMTFSYSEDKGIVQVDNLSKKSTQIVGVDKDWGKVKDLVGFATNVYLLDSIKNTIWKYVATSNGFSKYPYLDEDTKVDFLGAKQMLIDGSLWILKPAAEVLKYTAGVEDFFAFSKIDGEVADITSIYTSDETKYIYLIDPNNSRVLLLKKNGEYYAQIKGDKFKTASDLVVREDQKKLYLLENNVIYQLDLPF